MNDVQFRYFVAEGERAHRLMAEGLEAKQAWVDRRKALAAENGAHSLIWRRHSVPYGLVFKGGEHAQRKPGFRQPEIHREGDAKYHVHRPSLTSKAGKTLSQKLHLVGPEPNFSDAAAQEFGVDRMVAGSHPNSRTGMAVYFAVAGVIKDQLCIKVPVNDSEPLDAPPEFRELKKSEWIALTEED